MRLGVRPVGGDGRPAGRASELARAKEPIVHVPVTTGPASQAAPPHSFRRCTPGCAQASGLLLTPPRAMRCERPALCCSMIASSRAGQTGAIRHCGRGDASSRHPSPRCLPHSGTRIPCPPSRLPVSRIFGFRLSGVLCRCVAPVLLCRCFTLLPHACLPLSSADRAVADSPLFARRHPARPVQSTPVRTFLCCQ